MFEIHKDNNKLLKGYLKRWIRHKKFKLIHHNKKSILILSSGGDYYPYAYDAAGILTWLKVKGFSRRNLIQKIKSNKII